MLSKNKLYKIFYGKNYDSLYSGISGFFFIWAHKNLQSFMIHKEKSNKILEIGPGRFPHYNFDKQKISNKYQCMVSGVKRMEPCSGCSNPKGCLSNSMQYKERD